MDEPEDSGRTATTNETAICTAAENAAVNASTNDISPPVSALGNEVPIELRRSKPPSNPIIDRDGGTSEVKGPGDARQSKEVLAAYVTSPVLCDSSPTAQSALASGTKEEDVLEILTSKTDVADSEKDIQSSSLSSPSIESSENSYTSFEHSIDGPRNKDSIGGYDSESEGTGHDKHRINIDKGKGKEVAPRVSEQGPAPPAWGQQNQPLNKVPWVQDPERPPQKFPIRFTDCVGRNFVWPWKKAQTWIGAKKLVESAFLYVDVLGPHVFAGHYDLTIQGMWSDPKTAAINPALASYPAATTPQSSNSDNHVASHGAASSATSSSLQHGLPPPSTDVPPHLLPKMPGRGAIILPELWEDVVEPGMLIMMRMWPLAPSPLTHSHPSHMSVAPIHPPPAHLHGVGIGRGQGRGAVSATGRGSTQLPPPPPGWHQPPGRRGPPVVVGPYRPPRGKTRKRQDGL